MPPASSTKIVLPPAVPSTPVGSSQPRPTPRMRALPTTQADKDRARARFGEAHRGVTAKVHLAAAAVDIKAQRKAVRELSDALVSRGSFVLVVFLC